MASETAPAQRVASQSAATMHAPSAKPALSNHPIGCGTHSPSNTPSTYSPATISMGCFIYLMVGIKDEVGKLEDFS